MIEDIKIISGGDENYPKLLKKIKDAPKTLYCRGELKSDEKFFAVVGTRMYSSYGKQVALEIAGDLAETGLVIVSGLAPGIDTFSHQAAVERNKKTVAVLGTGIDKKTIYPQSNLGLVDKILNAKGCLISEYEPGTRGTNFSFPKRNRIVSGMSMGVLVVEAKEKSGSLITAELAVKQGKKLFAVPGPVHSPNSRGTNYLIKNGLAKLAENANDILKEFNLSFKMKKGVPDGNNPQENSILAALKDGGLDIDKIILNTKLSPAEVSGTLAVLEIKNKVRSLGKNIYALKH